jgi:hypothetical protein
MSMSKLQIFFEELIVTQLIKKFPTINEPQVSFWTTHICRIHITCSIVS